jgi:hypothetical protein
MGMPVPAELTEKGRPGAQRERRQPAAGLTADQLGKIGAGTAVSALPAGCHGTKP